MPSPTAVQAQIKQLAKEMRACQSHILKSYEKISSKISKTGDKKLKKRVADEVDIVKEKFQKIAKKVSLVENSVAENNSLLEWKQQDLQVQAEELKLSHQKILEKNTELEQQTESLLDQTDYLYEANQTITQMHEEVRRQKTEIEEKSRELEALNQEKNNLIGIVAHDLKSPLNQITGLASIIKLTNASMDRETVHCIDMIEKSATRLNEMINKILDVESIEAKKLNLTIEKVNLSKVMADLAERYLLNARQKQVEIFCTLEPNVFAELDKGYTEQVFENILSNALKFSPAYRSVYVKLQHQDGRAIAEIKDEGPGLNEEDKKKLFGKYQKLSAKPTGNETSTGLGLSIVKKFVEAMHGDIWCESMEGNGASFFVRFSTSQR
ncbi:MAG TPA: ATP-binding protein [Cyclobacteriaceae bacterium]|nr:ATP-binding protein [Cyclobacteriaceae bacterium]